MKKFFTIILVLSVGFTCTASNAAQIKPLSSPKYFCPNPSAIKVNKLTGQITPPIGWHNIPSQYGGSNPVPLPYAKQWPGSVNEIIYTQPIDTAYGGVAFTCEYFYPNTWNYGIVQLYKTAPNGFNDSLWDTQSPSEPMGDCTTSATPGECYWSLAY